MSAFASCSYFYFRCFQCFHCSDRLLNFCKCYVSQFVYEGLHFTFRFSLSFCFHTENHTPVCSVESVQKSLISVSSSEGRGPGLMALPCKKDQLRPKHRTHHTKVKKEKTSQMKVLSKRRISKG